MSCCDNESAWLFSISHLLGAETWMWIIVRVCIQAYVVLVPNCFYKIHHLFYKEYSFCWSLSSSRRLGMNAISKEVIGPNAMGKHPLLSDPRIESPPKRPKSTEGKTSANEQVIERKKNEKGNISCSVTDILEKTHLLVWNFWADLNKMRPLPITLINCNLHRHHGMN